MVAIERYDAERGKGRRPARDRLATIETAWEQLRTLFAAKPEKLADLVEEHIANGRRLLREIREHTERGEMEAVRQRAHSLKSSSAQFGSERVAELSYQLEKLPLESSREEVEELVGQLLGAWEHAEKRLVVNASGLRRAANP